MGAKGEINMIKKHRQGFTLVELIVVLLLFSILFGVGASSLYRYIRTASFRENNESAQSVFSAVQSGLTHNKSNGNLEELDRLCSETYENVKGNTDTFGKVDFDQLMVDVAEKPGIEKLKGEKRSLYYVILNRKDQENREKESLSDTVENQIYMMIEPYIYDKAVFDASICVEFDAKDGIVYSVSYVKNTEQFVYQEGSEKALGICNRTYNHRKEVLLGYYYAGMLSARAPYDMEKPVVGNVSLVNDETLTLQWNMSATYQDLAGALYYNIQVYDKETEQVRLSMTVNKSDIEDNALKLKSAVSKEEQTVVCMVTQYDEKGHQSGASKEYKFPAYVEMANNGKIPVMHLVLDAVDLQAGNVVTAQGTKESTVASETMGTYSISRFGIKNGEIFARVQAAGDGYRSSAWKETNVSHMYMASSSEVVDRHQFYGIKNARHLYNIRFMESELGLGELSNWTYVQHDSFAWGGETGIIAGGNVYAGGVPVDTQAADTAFPKVESLNEKAIYQGMGELPEVEYLTIKDEEKAEEIQETTGLFGRNYGTITNVALKNVHVEGANRTGGICGTNMGALNNITVSGEVSGKSYVGGICGQDAANSDFDRRTYQELENGAKVSGESHVGGIIGSLASMEQKDTASEGMELLHCINTGRISGSVGYVGGIVGYNDQGTLKNCNSTQRYTKDQLMEAVQQLQGVCVGGLIGYNRSGQMEQCSTGQTNQPGYVLGKEMVGGIVGFSVEKGENRTDDVQTTKLEGKCQTNGTHVIGEAYVGGIIGVNGPASVDFQKNQEGISIQFSLQQIPEGMAMSTYQISEWNNKGIVLVTSQYAGGIVGYNQGVLKNCVTRVNTATVSGKKQLEEWQEYGLVGSYVGGIAGYNDGSIEGTTTKQVVSVLSGGRFIGGITGYNGPKGDIDISYQIAGAYLDGEAFIGGYAGCNSSTRMLKKKNPQVLKISEIKGGYFVGSLFGANIVSCGTETGTYNLNVDVDSGFGEIKGTAFVGGVIGYNQLTKNIFSESKDSKEARETLETLSLENEKNAWESVENLFQNNRANAILCIKDQQPSLASIEASVLVGGMVGYNGEGSRLTLKNNVNNAAITAVGEITGLKGISDVTENYTFVGGMIGYARFGVVMDDCVNGATADIRSSKGNYIGGLTAVNDNATIENCTTRSIGSQKTSKLGGLAGINTGSGLIIECTVEQTIAGNTKIGGLVAYNDQNGGIQNCTFKGKVRGESNDIGGIVGTNQGQVMDINVKEGSIRGDGHNIGGIIGVNIGQGQLLGTIKNTKDCIVQGESNVGGFIGLNEINIHTKKAISAVNYAKITATQNNAGGIVGSIESNGFQNENPILKACKNYGEIRSNGEGSCAGGMTSILPDNARIESCTNHGLVLSSKGTNGGIVAKNQGSIQTCQVYGVNGENLALRGEKNVGGIAGINEKSGSISKSQVYDTVLTDIINGDIGSSLGGIVGTNHGIILDCNAGKADHQVIAGSYVGGGNTGGIAGTNSGSIMGGTAYTNLDFQGTMKKSLEGNVGGIAGVNADLISGCSYQGSLYGYKGEAVGYGGIAGINQNGDIQHCVVGEHMQAVITVEGSANSDVKVGGMVGINKTEATVSDSYLEQVRITTGYGFTGGIAGWNYGKITGSGAQDIESDKKVAIVQTFGHIGGIIGKNEEGGSANNVTTGEAWSVKASNHATDNTAGGIIGYNCSGEDMKNLRNFASVEKLKTQNDSNKNVVGGVIGRQEVTSNQTWTLSSCENYGAISGSARIGGIIGQWKYKGGTLKECINQGTIYANNSLAAGIVGFLYLGNSGDTMRLTKCENHGIIQCNNSTASGLFGDINGSGSKKIYLSQCVNTGDLKGVGKVNGIIGENKESSTSVYLKQCQNYGKKMNSNSVLYGMSQSSLKGGKECFSVSDADEPIDQNGNKTISSDKQFNYYFSNDANQDTSGKYLSVMAAYASKQPKNMVDGTISEDSRWDYNNGSTTWKNPATVQVKFIKPTWINKITTYWYAGSSDSGKRSYKYQLYYLDSAGNRHQIIEKSDGSENFTGIGWNSAQASQRGESVEFDKVKAYGYEVVINHVNSAYASIYELEINEEKNSANAILQYNNLAFQVEEGSTKKFRAIQSVLDVSIDLDVNPIKFSGTGNELYQKTKDDIYHFYYEQYKEKPDAPQNIQLVDQNGSYQVSWKEVANAYSYRVELYAADNAEMTEGKTLLKSMDIYDASVNGTLSALFEGENQWQTQYLGVKVTAYNYNQTLSSEGWSNTLYVKKELPVPQVHFELTGTDKNTAYEVILDNVEDYLGISNQVEISVNSGNKVSFLASEQGKKQIAIGSSGTIQITMKAEPKGSLSNSYRASATYSIQTRAMDMGALTNITGNTATFQGFFGDTPRNLSYQILLKPAMSQQNSYQWYERQELLMEDETLGGIPVVVSSGEVRVSADQTVSLKNLPESIANENNVSVRVYPWATQNHTIYFGHVIGEGLTKEQVLSSEAIDATGSLKQGYVVEGEGNGSYTIRYSIMLGNEAFKIQRKETTPTIPKAMEEPVLECEKVDRNSYRIAWDKESGQGKYQVLALGVLPDGETIELTSMAETTEHSVVIDDVLKCVNIQLEVTRIGTTKTTGETQILGAKAIEVFKLYPALTSIQQPKVALVDQNELEYRITWDPLEEDEEMKQLKGYRIVVQDTAGNEAESMTVSKNVISAVMDLEKYEGTIRKIYVQALAEAGGDYSDSELDYGYEQTIASRMQQPSTDIITMIPVWGATSSVTYRSFMEDGIKLNIADSDESVSYLMDAKVVDRDGNVLKDFGRDNQADANKQFQIHSETEGWTAAFAGQYLEVKIRKNAPDAISSKWSETATFRLPRVKLDSLALTVDQITNQVEETMTASTGAFEKRNVDVEQDAITWNPIAYAEVYQIIVKENNQEQTEHEMLLRKDGNTWKVKVLKPIQKNEAGEEIEPEWVSLKAEEDKEKKQIIYTSDTISYEKDIHISAEGLSYETVMKAYVTVTEDLEKHKTILSMVLPDAQDYHKQSLRTTQEVQIRPMFLGMVHNKESVLCDTDYYSAGNIRKWLRTEKIDIDGTTIYGIEIKEVTP